MHETPLGRVVIGAAIEVHSELGPRLLESMYERCLAYELTIRGVTFERQLGLPIRYKELDLGEGYRLDFLVEGELLVELKSVEQVLPVHHAQVLTYLRLTGVKQGLLINFNVRRLTDGLKSFLWTPRTVPHPP